MVRVKTFSKRKYRPTVIVGDKELGDVGPLLSLQDIYGHCSAEVVGNRNERRIRNRHAIQLTGLPSDADYTPNAYIGCVNSPGVEASAQDVEVKDPVVLIPFFDGSWCGVPINPLDHPFYGIKATPNVLLGFVWDSLIEGAERVIGKRLNDRGTADLVKGDAIDRLGTPPQRIAGDVNESASPDCSGSCDLSDGKVCSCKADTGTAANTPDTVTSEDNKTALDTPKPKNATNLWDDNYAAIAW